MADDQVVLEILDSLCTMMEKKVSLDEMAEALGKSSTTISNYLKKLNDAKIVYTISWRGIKGAPKLYQLEISRAQAMKKIKAYLTDKKQKELKKYYESLSKEYSLDGIAGWLFITRDRAIAYAEWSEPWTLH